jgi:hypothetical protein
VGSAFAAECANKTKTEATNTEALCMALPPGTILLVVAQILLLIKSVKDWT